MINCYFKTCKQEGRSSGQGANTEAEHQWNNVCFFFYICSTEREEKRCIRICEKVSACMCGTLVIFFCVLHWSIIETRKTKDRRKCVQSVQHSLYSPRVCSTIVSSATSSCACCWNAWNRSSREELKRLSTTTNKSIFISAHTKQKYNQWTGMLMVQALYIRDVTKLEFQTRYHFQCHEKVSTPCCNNRSNGAEFISAAALYIPSSAHQTWNPSDSCSALDFTHYLLGLVLHTLDSTQFSYGSPATSQSQRPISVCNLLCHGSVLQHDLQSTSCYFNANRWLMWLSDNC